MKSLATLLHPQGWRALAPFAGALLTGMALVLAFSPAGWFWLAPLALAVLFRLADKTAPRRAALIGLAFGIGQFGAGTYWILIALSGIGGAPLPLALALLIGLVLVLAGFPAIVLAAGARVAPAAGPLRYLLWLPLLWTLLEWLRSWVFSGFPWLSIGYSQIDSPLRGYAPVFGVFGISLAVALSAGALAWLSVQPRRAPWALGALIGVWAVGFGLSQLSWTQPYGKLLSVTLVQGDVDQQSKWSQEAVDQAIGRYSQLMRGHWQSNLVVWPETAIPDYYYAVQPALESLGKRLATHDTTLLTGLLTVDRVNRRIYNSVAAVGAGQGLYSKRHLVPFGEYFPAPVFIRRWMAESGMPYADFTPGALDQAPIKANGVALAISICYEDVFGSLIARDVPPADVLINVSDDAWFGRSIGPAQHFEMARMRAVETGRYLLRADNSAVTAIVGPKGHVESRAPDFQPTVVTGAIRAYRGQTPFVRWHDWAIVLLLVVLAAGGLVARRRRR